jgi:hypothetical protein
MSPDLSGKSAAELKSMVANAEKILAGPNVKQHGPAAVFRDAAMAALSARRVVPGASKATPNPALDAAILRIREVAAEAQARWDLSTDSASAQGVRTPHALLSAGGAPKTGGGVRTKKFRRCPYISYRGRDGIAMLQYAVPPGDEAEGFWSGGMAAVGSEESKTGFDRPMAEIDAVAAFFNALEKLAPKHRAGGA